MNSIKILGSGKYLPEQVATNEDFAKFMDTNDEWIRTRTGMSERRIATGETTWYIGAKAGEIALKNSGLTKDDIDLVLVSTVNPGFYTPSVSSLIQRHLGIEDAMALDINVACTGFCFGLDFARRYLMDDDIKNILFVSAEELSQMTNYEDRSSCILFGDGAGAHVITKAEGLYGSYQRCDTSGTEHLYAKLSRKTHPFNAVSDTSAYDPFHCEVEDYIYMNGKEVYKFATKAMPLAVEKACEKAGVAIDRLDIIIPHQANLRIIQTAVKNLGIEESKVFVNIEKYANCSSASSSIALCEALEAGRIKPGDKVCIVGFGAGLTYGAVVFEY